MLIYRNAKGVHVQRKFGNSLSRRATQIMSATRNSPTIRINLRALLLSAVTVSLHYLPRCLCSIVTCGKTPTIVTWTASSKICWHVIVTQHSRTIRSRISQPASAGKEAD